MITWNNGQVSFRANNRKYLSDENGQGRIRFNRDKAGLWEKFDVKYDRNLKGYYIIRAGETPKTGFYYLFGSNYLSFGIEYLREDSVFRIINL